MPWETVLAEEKHECIYISAREGWYCPVCDEYWADYVECLKHMPCGDHDNERDCELAGCYWYDDACHSEPEKPPVKKPSKLTIYASPISGVAPLSVVVDGYLYDADTMSPLASRRINLYQDGAYVGYKVTARNGYYRFDVELEVGTYDFYTEFEGDAEYEGCEKLW